MFGIPATGAGSSNPIIQNKKLHHTLLAVGGTLIAVGILLSFYAHPAAHTIGSVSLTLGAPIMLLGIILSIYRKSLQESSSSHQQSHSQDSSTVSSQSPFRGTGYRLGRGNSTPQTAPIGRDSETSPPPYEETTEEADT